MDWNNDGKNDLLSGDTKGQVWIFLNKGTKKAPKLDKGVRVQADGKAIVGVRPKYERGKDGRMRQVKNDKDVAGIYSKLHYGDWDSDGRQDLLIGKDGRGGQKLVWYKNTGTRKKPKFAAPEVIKAPLPKASRPSPYLVDLDGDGNRDILFGTDSRTVHFFRNKGTTKKPKWDKDVILTLDGDGFKKGYRYRIAVVDWNNDGKLDLLAGNYAGGGGNVWLFLRK